jgi:hypothetical protein
MFLFSYYEIMSKALSKIEELDTGIVNKELYGIIFDYLDVQRSKIVFRRINSDSRKAIPAHRLVTPEIKNRLSLEQRTKYEWEANKKTKFTYTRHIYGKYASEAQYSIVAGIYSTLDNIISLPNISKQYDEKWIAKCYITVHHDGERDGGKRDAYTIEYAYEGECHKFENDVRSSTILINNLDGSFKSLRGKLSEHKLIVIESLRQ